MTFEERTHYDAIRKFMRTKPIDRPRIYFLGNKALWTITQLSEVVTPFGPKSYEIHLRSPTDVRVATIKESELLSRIILQHELVIKYPEFLI